MGGLAIGQEVYLYNATGTVGPTPYAYPQIGDYQWYMDYPWPTQLDPYGQLDFTADILPSRPAILPSQANPWMPYTSGVNYMTGTTAGTETAADYGCVHCHSYNSIITTDGAGVPSYALDDWGVTCANCHADTAAYTATPAGRRTIAHAGPYFDAAVCLKCHQRTPVAPVSGETTGRPQQIAMEIWDIGPVQDQLQPGLRGVQASQRAPRRRSPARSRPPAAPGTRTRGRWS